MYHLVLFLLVLLNSFESFFASPGFRTLTPKKTVSKNVYPPSQPVQCGIVKKPGWVPLPLPPGAKQRFNVTVSDIYVSKLSTAWSCILPSGRIQLSNPIPLSLDLRNARLTYNVSLRGVGSMHFEQSGMALILSDPSKTRGERAFYKTPVLNYTLHRDGNLLTTRLPVLSDQTIQTPLKTLEIPPALRNVSLGYHVSDILRVELIGDEQTIKDIALRRDVLLTRNWRGLWKIVSNRTTALLIDDGATWDTGVSLAQLCKKPPKNIWARISQLPSIKAPSRLVHASIDSINCRGNFSFVATVDVVGAWTRNVQFVDARLDAMSAKSMATIIKSGSGTLNSKTNTWTLKFLIPTNYTLARVSGTDLQVGKTQGYMQVVYVKSPTQEYISFAPPTAIPLKGGPPVQPKDKLSSHFPGVVKRITNALQVEYSRLDETFLAPLFSKIIKQLGNRAVIFKDTFYDASAQNLGVSHLTLYVNFSNPGKSTVDLYGNVLMGSLLFSLDFAFEYSRNSWKMSEALGHYTLPGTDGYLGYVSVNFIDRACNGNHPAFFDLSGVPEKPMLNPLTDERTVFGNATQLKGNGTVWLKCNDDGVQELRMQASIKYTASLYGVPKMFVGIYELSSHELHSNFTAKSGYGTSNIKIHLPHHYSERLPADKPLPMWQINGLPTSKHLIQALTKIIGNDSGSHLHAKIWQIDSSFIRTLDQKNGKNLTLGYHQEHDMGSGQPVMNEQITVEALVFDQIMGKPIVKRVRGRRMSGINLYPALPTVTTTTTRKSTSRKVSTGKVSTTRVSSKSTKKSFTGKVTSSRRKSSIVLGTTKSTKLTKSLTTSKFVERDFYKEGQRVEFEFPMEPIHQKLSPRGFLLPLTVTVCDGGSWNPTCPSGQNIRILSATLGRWANNTVCPASNGLMGYPGSTNCTASDMMTSLTTTCGSCSKNNCSYTVNSANFGWGSPSTYLSIWGNCYNSYKYALITYVCVVPTQCAAATTYSTAVTTATCTSPAAHAALQRRWMEKRLIWPTQTHTSSTKTTTKTTLNATPTYLLATLVADPISGFDFDYNLGFGNASVSIGFGDVGDSCPSGFARSELRVENVMALQNFTGMGFTWFSCSNSSGASEAVAFNALSKLDVLPGVRNGNGFMSLRNASVQVSCVPDQASCFVPSFLHSSFPTIWSWIGKVGSNYTWSQLATNLTGVVGHYVGNLSDYPSAQASLVNGTAELAQWPRVVPLTDVWGASLFSLNGVSNISLPVASPLCSNNFITNCSTPLIAVAGTILNTSTVVANYATLMNTNHNTGVSVSRQMLGVTLSNLGYVFSNWTEGGLCGMFYTNMSLIASNNFNAYNGGGTINITCDANGNVTDMIILSNAVNVPLVSIAGHIWTMPSAKYVYQHSTNIFGLTKSSGGTGDYIYRFGYTLDNVGTSFINVTSAAGGYISDVLNSVPLDTILTRTNYQSFTSTTWLNHFSIVKGAGDLQIYANRSWTIGSVKITANAVATVNILQSLTHSLTTTVTLTRDGSSISFQENYLACQNGNTGNSNSQFFLVLPFGNLTGQGQTSYVCQPNITDFNFHASISVAFNTTLFGGCTMASAVVNLQASTGAMQIAMSGSNSIITANLIMGVNSTQLVNVTMHTSGAIVNGLIGPGNWNMLGNVGILKNVTLQGVDLQYLVDSVNGDAFTLSSNANVGLGNNVGVYIAMSQVLSKWTLTTAVLELTVGSTMSLNISTGPPCVVTEQSLVGYVSGGNLRQTSFVGDVLFVCNAGNVTSWSFTGNSSSATVTASGIPQTVALNVSWDSISKEFVFNGVENGAATPWTLQGDFNTSNPSIYDVNYVAPGTWSFGSLPFAYYLEATFNGAGKGRLTSAQVSNVTVNLQGNDHNANILFSGTLQTAVDGFSVGAGIALTATTLLNNNAFTVVSYQVAIGLSFFIPNVGVVSVTGQAGDCTTVPNWTATATVQLANLPGIQNLNGTGTVTVNCTTGSWVGVLNVPVLTLNAMGQTVTLTNVVLQITSTSVALNGSVVGSTMGATVNALWSVGPTVLQSVQVICSQPTTIYDPTMPFGSTLTSAANSSVTGLQWGLSVTYEFGNVSTINMTSAIQNGPLQAQAVVNFSKGTGNWTMDYTGFNLVTTYGTLTFSGGQPCPVGLMSASASLTLPALTSAGAGTVQFGCNGTNITSYYVSLQDTFTINAFGYGTTMSGTLVYDSVSKWFNVTASPNGITQFYCFTDGHTNTSYYTYGYQLIQPSGLAQLPVSQLYQNLFYTGYPSRTKLNATTMYWVNLQFAHAGNGGETLGFNSILSDPASGTTLVNASVAMSWSRASNNGTWSKTSAIFQLGILVDGVASLSFILLPACYVNHPTTMISMTATFFSLPMGIQPFSAQGTLTFACNGTTPNYKNYAWQVSVQPTQPLNLNFLGENIPIKSPLISYNSSNPVFNMAWNFSSSFAFNLGWSRGASQHTPYPYTLSGLPLGSVNIASILSDISSVLSSFANVIGGDPSFGTLSFLGTEGRRIYNTLTGISLSGTSLTFDDVNGNIHFATTMNFWGLAVNFQSLSPKMGGSQWSSIWGISFYPPNVIPKNPNSGIQWVDSMFNVANGLNFTNVFFGMSTGAGIYDLPTGLNVETNGIGIVLAGDLLVSSNTMQQLKQETGMFGHLLSQSVALEFAIDFTPSYVMCSIDLQTNLTSGSQTFEDIQFQIQVDTEAFEVTLWFAFLYRRTDVSPSLIYDGSVGIAVNDLGGDFEWKFWWQGQWNNPFGLAPAVTLNSVYLDLGLNFETMLPTQFGMALGGVIHGLDKDMNIAGQLYLDLSTPQENNAVAIQASNMDLDTILQLWLSNPDYPGLALVPFPKEMRQWLTKFTCDTFDVSYNPSLTPISFAPGLPTIPAGIHLNITNMSFDGYLVIRYATFDMVSDTLAGSLSLAPIDYDMFSVTAVGNSNVGPFGSFSITPTHVTFALNGQISLFGIFTAMVNVSIQAGVTDKGMNNFLEGRFSLYGDFVDVVLNQTGHEKDWSWYMMFEIGTAQGQTGFFTSVINGWICDVTGKLNQFVSDVEAAVTESATNSINRANDALNSAEQAVASAEASVNAAVDKAKKSVDSAQGKVDELGHKCHEYGHKCHKFNVGACAAYGACKVAHFAASLGLDVAKDALDAAEAAVDQILQQAEQGLRDSETALDSAIRLGEELVDGVMGALNSAIQSLMSGLATAIGDFVVITDLKVSDYISSSGQTKFSASITIGFFNSSPKKFSFTFDANDIWATIQVLIDNGAHDVLNWLQHQLGNTPASPYLHDLSSLF